MHKIQVICWTTQHGFSFSDPPVPGFWKVFSKTVRVDTKFSWLPFCNSVQIFWKVVSVNTRFFATCYFITLWKTDFLSHSKLGFYILFNSQGHIGTGPQHCHLWDSNPQRWQPVIRLDLVWWFKNLYHIFGQKWPINNHESHNVTHTFIFCNSVESQMNM